MPFIYYKNPMNTRFSVVESNPPLASRRRPVSFSFPPVVAISFRPPVVKFCQVPLTRSTPAHARSHSRPRSVHTRSVHGSRRASQFTTHTSTFRSYRSTDLFSSYLRRPLRYPHRPSCNTHPENQPFDSQSVRSFYI